MLKKIHHLMQYNTAFVFLLVAAAALCYGIVYFDMAENSYRIRVVHAPYHIATVYQLLNGIFPPTNVLAMEQPNNNYWMWHLFIAGISKLFSISPLESVVISNATGLSLVVIAMMVYVRHFTHKLVYLLLLPPVVFFVVLSHPLLAPLLTDLGLRGSDYTLVKRAFRLPLNVNLLHKFFTVNGFAVGVGFLAIVSALTPISSRVKRSRAAFLFIMALISCLFHPATALGIGILGLALLANIVFSALFKKELCASDEWVKFAAVFGAFLCSVPYLMSMASAANVANPLTFSLDFILLIYARFLPAIFPVLIIAALSFFILFKMDSAGRTNFFYLLGFMMAMALVSLPNGNQYKYALMISLPATMAIPHLCRHYLRLPPALKNTLPYLLLPLLLYMPYKNTERIFRVLENSPHTRKLYPYTFDGTQTNFDVSACKKRQSCRYRQAALSWIREYTPKDAYLMSYPPDWDRIEVSVISERRIIVSRPYFRNKSIPYIETLYTRVRSIVQNTGRYRYSVKGFRKLFSIPASWPETFYLMTRNPKHLNLDALKEKSSHVRHFMTPIYRNRDWAVYKVYPCRLDKNMCKKSNK